MSFEKEFDKIIRQKAQTNHVPFDENNWEKAQHMLDAQRNVVAVKSGFTASKLIYLLSFVALVGTGTFLLYNGSQSNNEVAIKKDSEQLNSKQDPTAILESNNVPLNKEQENKADLIDSRESSSSIPQPEGKKQNVSKTEESTSVNSALEPVSIQDKNTQITHDQNSISKATINASTNNLLNEKVSLINNKADGLKPENENIVDESNQDKIEGNKLITSKNNESDNFSINNKTANSGNTLTEFDPAQESLIPNNVDAEFEMMHPYKISTNAFDTTIHVSPIIQLDRYNDGNNRSTSKSFFMNFGIGLNYNLGWSTPNGKDANGLNYYGNINVGHYVNKKVGMGLGFDIYNISNIQQPFFINQKKEFSFGSSYSYTSVTTNQLTYIGIPLKLYYDLNYHNTLSVGFMPSLLMQAKNTIKNYTETDGQKIIQKNESNRELYNGIAQKTFLISAGFKSNIYKRIWIDAEANYGFTDLFLNNASNQTKQIPIGIRLGIQFNLIK